MGRTWVKTWVKTWVTPADDCFLIGEFERHRFRQEHINKLPKRELFFRLFIWQNPKLASAGVLRSSAAAAYHGRVKAQLIVRAINFQSKA
jgi:hypothetical protein